MQPSQFVRPLLAVVILQAILGGISLAQQARPNVVLVLVDDLGWSDLSCQGSAYYETPHIDRLAAEGMRFTDAYAACAVCSPTRAAVMTGRYPARTGVTDWIRARFQRGGTGTPKENPSEYVGGPKRKLLCPPNPFWLDLQEITIAEVLKRAGYATCHIGKWHLGDEAWYPQHQGFDENHGGCDYGQPPSYFDPYRNERLKVGIPTLAPRKPGEYLTDREADEAATFIRKNRDRPFFLYLAHYAVHTPIQAKEDLRQRYDRKTRTHQKNAKYAAMVHSVDDAMGRILETLEKSGVADRTLIIFTSDNGGLSGPTNNAPLRSGKGFPYEGGVRVPLIIKWPGVVAGGSLSREPVTSVDYLPTVAEITEVPSPSKREIDGISLAAHLRSQGVQPLGRAALYWHFPHYRGGGVTPYGIVRAGRWKLIKRYEEPSFELFDLAEDLGEEKDLAASQPDRVAALDRLLMSHLERTRARLPRKNPDYRPPATPEPDSKPRVLLLGDSISIGYTAPVRDLLRDEARVFRPMRANGRPENCAGTTYGVGRIDAWLRAQGGNWDVIHFNFGLHDLKRVHPETKKNSNDPAHPRQAPLEQYREQLTEIVERLQKTGAVLIFATTTPVPSGVRPLRDVEDPERYNQAATAIMKTRGIAVNDLYSFALPRLAALQRPADVHFKPAGSNALAQQVAEHIRRALRARR